MSLVDAREAGPAGTAEQPGPARWWRRRAVVAAAAVALSWLLPLATDLLRLDWLLPVLLLVATASLLRAGRTVLDRLVLATGLLFGGTCAAGLVLSVWPWHLHPVPVAGVAGTALVLAAVALRRRPELPRSWRLPDTLVLAATAVAAVVPLAPLRHGLLAWRLGLAVSGDDFSRHYMIYDAIRASGGYLFMHTDRVPYVTDGYLAYPQGTHLVLAVLENFLRSSPVAADPLGGIDHLVWFTLFGEVFLYLAVLWGIRYVAGPWLAGWSAAPVLAVAAGYLAFSDPITLVLNGYLPELPGLALLALLLALMARRTGGPREQLVLLGALTVAVSFAYYLWLPAVAVAWLGWLVRHRREVLRRWRTAAVVLPVAGLLALVPPLVNTAAIGGKQLVATGGAAHVNRAVVLAFAVLAVAPLGLRLVRRLPVFRFAVVEVGGAALFAAGLYLYQRHTTGHSSYYFEKTLHQLGIVSLIWLGAPAVLLLAEIRREAWAQRRAAAREHRTWWWRAAPWRSTGWRPLGSAVACLLLAATVMGLFAMPVPAPPSTHGVQFARDRQSFPLTGDAIAQAYRHFPRADGYVTVVLVTPDRPYQQAWQTLYVNDLQRNYPAVSDLYVYMYPGTTPNLTTARFQDYLLAHRVRARIVSTIPAELDSYRDFARRHPELGTAVVDARGWWRAPAV